MPPRIAAAPKETTQVTYVHLRPTTSPAQPKIRPPAMEAKPCKVVTSTRLLVETARVCDM
jgi:hypothetical protein